MARYVTNFPFPLQLRPAGHTRVHRAPPWGLTRRLVRGSPLPLKIHAAVAAQIGYDSPVFEDYAIHLAYLIAKTCIWACKGAYRTTRYSLLRASAQGWPITEALIQVVLPDPPDSFLGVQIEYEYCVDGVYYSGVLLRDTLSKDSYTRHFVPRQRYFVHYDPERPERSCLPLDAEPVLHPESRAPATRN